MTDQKENEESKCPFLNPHAPANETPAHTPPQQPTTHHLPPPKPRHNTLRLLLWCVLLAFVLYASYLYFSYPHNAHVHAPAPVTTTVPDSGKDSTLVTPTTATNIDTQENASPTQPAESTS